MPAINRHSRRMSPAFAIGGIGYEPSQFDPEQGVNFKPFGGWTCFHCSERFTEARAAARHFGTAPDTVPLCIAVAEKLDETREVYVRRVLERLIARAISDPGRSEGFKGERSLTEWQVAAVMRLLDGENAPPPLDPIHQGAIVRPLS